MTAEASTAEVDFIIKALQAGVRCDGRQRLETRPLRMTLGTDGHVEVQLGKTKVMAVATAELVEPSVDRPTEGQLHFFVELSPMACLAFEPGRPSELAVELTRLLDRALKKSQAIDIEAMCVVAGKRAWCVRCDVTVLDHCGNLSDSVCIAALAALKHLRIPAVTVTGVGDEALVNELAIDQADPQPLVFHHMPVPVSLGFFRSSDEADSLQYVIDPTEREELVMAGSLVIVLNQHQELCALQKPGGLLVEGAAFLDAVQSAAAAAPAVRSVLQRAMEARAEAALATATELARTGRLPTRSLATSGPAVGLGATNTECQDDLAAPDALAVVKEPEPAPAPAPAPSTSPKQVKRRKKV